MSITPADIEAQTFPLVFRGYKVESVDAFLDRLQADLAERLADPAENAGTGTPTEADRLAGQEGSHAARALRTLARAEEMAEQMMADAAAEADGIRARAHVEAEDVIAAAKVEISRVESELELRRHRELGALSMQAQRLRAEIDRLSGLERQYNEAMQAMLSEQQRLLEQRLPLLEGETVADVTSAPDALRPAA
ncbi:MAG: DivIVA domain-containing protein [Blastococcus sp.]